MNRPWKLESFSSGAALPDQAQHMRRPLRQNLFSQSLNSTPGTAIANQTRLRECAASQAAPVINGTAARVISAAVRP